MCVCFSMPAFRWRQMLRHADETAQPERKVKNKGYNSFREDVLLIAAPPRLHPFSPFSLLHGPFFLSPLSACHFCVSHLSFDMEISHQPQPKARRLVPKMYLLKAAHFLIKCSRWVDKRRVLYKNNN